jgi:hypothetical protein
VPRRYGGRGITATDFFGLLAELAAAESNLAQALRAHICSVEDRLVAAETPPAIPGSAVTTLMPDGRHFRLNGWKATQQAGRPAELSAWSHTW